MYDLYIGEDILLFGKQDKAMINKECDLYDFLYERLDEKTKRCLAEYLFVLQERHAKELRAVYTRGFKDAIQLWEESLKE